MVFVLIVVLAVAVLALAALLLRLLYQLNTWTALLEASDVDSNLRLPAALRLRPVLRLCRAVNNRLDQAQQRTLQARRSGEELQTAMAAVSHDIRTPLAAASGYLELMRQEPDAQKRDTYLSVIDRRLQDLETLLDQLFLYTRLNAGDTQAVQVAPVQLWPVLCEALSALYPQLSRAGVEPELLFPDTGQWVQADREALLRVLRNLIANAVQHGAGGLVIRQRPNGLAVENQVPDPAELDLPHLFDRFWRADPARRSGHGGSGLGLAIVQRLTEAMGGRVEAQLTGHTLCLTLTLPPAPPATPQGSAATAGQNRPEQPE